MEKFYLLDYIKENYKIPPDIFDSIKLELDQYLYYYGNHFKYPKESPKYIRIWLREMFLFLKMLMSRKHVKGNKKVIISNAYFNLNTELEKIGYEVYKPIWDTSRKGEMLVDIKTYLKMAIIRNIFYKRNFNFLINKEFLKKVNNFKILLKNYYILNNIQCLIVPNDIAFFENISIKIFKEIGKPSFVFLHGIPQYYDNIESARGDYLIVWGEKTKESFIKFGIDENKIFVSGHPLYKDLIEDRNLKFSLDNVLVLTTAMCGGQYSNEVILSDRGNLILYLYTIENVLKKFKVEHARLRMHPSENSKWYLRFIDNKFYKIDTNNLRDSLNKATLVIGPGSTVFVESIYYGINYIIYIPSKNNIDLLNYKLVPPFDGSDERIPVAKNEEELAKIIYEKKMVDKSCLKDYIKFPFDISFVKKLIG